MKKLTCLIAAALGFAITALAEPPLKSVEALALSDGERSYSVADGEANVNDELIRRFTIGRKSVTASYRNPREKATAPEYTIRLYNAYGLLLGEDTVRSSMFGSTPYVNPGDVATQDLHIKWLPLDRIFEKAKATLPTDWRTVVWVVISDSNTAANQALHPTK